MATVVEVTASDAVVTEASLTGGELPSALLADDAAERIARCLTNVPDQDARQDRTYGVARQVAQLIDELEIGGRDGQRRAFLDVALFAVWNALMLDGLKYIDRNPFLQPGR